MKHSNKIMLAHSRVLDSGLKLKHIQRFSKLLSLLKNQERLKKHSFMDLAIELIWARNKGLVADRSPITLTYTLGPCIELDEKSVHRDQIAHMITYTDLGNRVIMALKKE